MFDDDAGLLASEEWQIGKIECRMKLGEWNEAKRYIRTLYPILGKELNVGPSPRLLEKYKTISEKTDNAMSSFDNMLDFVKEKFPGRILCPFPASLTHAEFFPAIWSETVFLVTSCSCLSVISVRM